MILTVGIFAFGKTSASESLADTLMRIELEVSTSFHLYDAVSNKQAYTRQDLCTQDRQNYFCPRLVYRNQLLNYWRTLLGQSTFSRRFHRTNGYFRISAGGANIRIEYFAAPMSYADAFSLVSDFYTDKKKSDAASESFKSGRYYARKMGVVLIECYYREIDGRGGWFPKTSSNCACPCRQTSLSVQHSGRISRNQIFQQVHDPGAHAPCC